MTTEAESLQFVAWRFDTQWWMERIIHLLLPLIYDTLWFGSVLWFRTDILFTKKTAESVLVSYV